MEYRWTSDGVATEGERSQSEVKREKRVWRLDSTLFCNGVIDSCLYSFLFFLSSPGVIP